MWRKATVEMLNLRSAPEERLMSTREDPIKGKDFLESLSSFSKLHRAQRWEGTFAEFLTNVVSANAAAAARSSHQYIWDMLRWHGHGHDEGGDSLKARALFRRELFGIDEPLSRVVDYFKAAAAGSDVGRRLLLLLGPPSGGKSTLAILMKRGLEEYSRTEAGALYGIKGSPLRENPLNLVPASLRAEFRERYGVDIVGELSPWAREFVEREFDGDFGRVPVERIFIDERRAPASAPTRRMIRPRLTSRTWWARWTSPRSPRSATKGDPRAWSWSGAVYAASRGMLEMIEILKVKREFLYLLLTMTQEKNVKVSRFPLIHLDETILAHTNLAEFHKFLQEKENEALLDRMVIIKVPYSLSYQDEARIYKKLVVGAPAFRDVHLDPHVLDLALGVRHPDAAQQARARGPGPCQEAAAVFRRSGGGRAGVRSRASEGRKLRRGPDRRESAVRHQRDFQCHHPRQYPQPHQHGAAAALKDSIDSDARMESKHKKVWIDHLVTARKEFYNRWVKEDVHRAMFASFEAEAQQLLEKYLDEVEASLDHRQVTDPITRRDPPGRRTLPAPGRGEDQGFGFRQAVVPPGSGAQGDGCVQDRREIPPGEPCAHARSHRAVPVRGAPRRVAAGDLHGAPGR